ncbi:MFS transporter, DHA1 family, tetracycline resistance protein [Ekhidna lutea]|uniref:MFS transporter, DHA1 family, tetracycline resistance protein n=1 Tax=Ekhidna lutea TaxID=447679 RepID=A0A239FK03_EKHLU|nr:TCR/Tet family MFS transporter [Ekhidna lutea]SNS57259.1 MFS transporter, DHA1 family, tetracycline resistance protein [Ekhidna lutea]
MKKKQAAIIFIFATVLIDIIGIGLIIPILPKLFNEVAGLNPSEGSFIGGALIATYGVMQFFFAPILGGLSDKYGRRPLLLIALFGLGVDYLIIVFAPTLAWFFVARVIAGICGSSVTVANAYIADISTPENKAKNFGMIGAAFGLGFIVGPALGGFLGEIGTRIPFMLAAGLAFLNMIYGYFIIPESLKEEDRRDFSWKRANPLGTFKQVFSYKKIVGLLLSMFFIYVAANATHTNWSYFTSEKFGWSPQDIGLSLTFVGVMVAIVQGGLVGPIVKKIGEVNAVYTGFLFNAFGLFMMGIVPHGWMVYAVIIPYAFGGLAGPSLQSIMTGEVPKNAQGELQGGIAGIMTLTSIVGPLLMTGVFRYYTNVENDIYFPGAPFMVGTAIAILSIFIARTSLVKMKRT